VATPFVLLYNNGYLGQTALLNAAANGITPANLSFSVGNSYDFAAISVNGQATTVITVANSGQATASGLAFSGLSSPFSIVQNGCGATLSGGATCSLTVEFAPTAANNFSENLQLSYGNGLITTGVSTQLTGSGSANPTLGLGGGNGGGNEGSGGSSGTSENYNFGNVFVGGNATASFTLNYTGLNAASIVSVTSLNGPDFFFDSGSSFPGSGTCGANQITTTCTFGLMFKPSKTGLLSASFSLVYNDGVSQKTLQINLSGHGIQPAVLTASPASQVFASTPLNYTRALMFSVTNSSSSQSSANLSSLSSISSPFTYAGGTCFGVNGNSPMKLAPNASCTVIVSFEPAAANTFNQSISLAYNDGAQAQVLSLGTSGTGTSAAVLVLEQGTSYNFGSVVEEKTATAQISVQYYGANTASVQSMQVSAPFTITGGTCTNSITQSCTIGVSFTPTAAASSSSALTVTYADGTGATQTASVTLSGTGVSPALLSTPPTLSFNPVLVSTSESLNLTISNSGSTAASNIQFSGLTEPFSITTNTCTGSVSSTCKIGVNFTSSTSGSFSQTLQIAYFDGEANQSISVAVSSSSQTAPQLTSTPQGLGSFAAIALGSQTSLTYLIANTGSDNASSMTLQNPSAQVGFTISQNTCGSALAIGQSCLITVLFNPSTPGTSSDRFILSYMGSTSGSFTLSQALSAQSSVPVQLATKGNHTCVINHSGQVECWGESDYGQTGPAQKQAISLGTGHYATAVATGFFHTCAILENGMLKCWGRNDSGQLGLGDSLNRGLSANDLGDNLPAVNLGTGRTAKAISLGYSHTCAILDNGTVKCWGQNLQGQLGQGDTLTRGLLATDMGDHLAPVSLGTGLTALSISSNVGHNCVLLSNQSMKCWGDNFYGELGLGDSVNRGSLPNQMGDNLPAVALPTGPTGMIPAQVNTGGGFTCVNSTLGQVSCWGFNYHGTLGTCWALNSQGQLGSCFNVGYTNYIQGYGLSAGEMGNALPAVDLGLSELSIPVQAVASGTSFTCVTYSNGSGLKCFGDNTQGQLGQGDLTNAGDQPNEMGSNLQSVNLGTNIAIRNIVAGSFHACAVFQDDSVRCWGANAQGQLGMSLSNPNWGASANQMGSDLPVVSF
jgi:alpha-tubulin suppressor-like RCC1 family protein